jgi:hypothetical protein
MNITIKITYWGGTVMDVCIPVAIETPKPVEAPQPAVVTEEEPLGSVEPDDIMPEVKQPEPMEEFPQDTTGQFRCTDGFYCIPQTLYSDFCSAFGQPMVDRELELARLWVETNPPKRKTRRGMGRFLNAWMCRAQGEKRQPLKGRSGSLLEANNTSSQGW